MICPSGEKKRLKHTHFLFRPVIWVTWLEKEANGKQNKKKIHHIKTFKIHNIYVFFSFRAAVFLAPWSFFHCKPSSLALIYQQTLKTPLSLGSDTRGLPGKESATADTHTRSQSGLPDPHWQLLGFGQVQVRWSDISIMIKEFLKTCKEMCNGNMTKVVWVTSASHMMLSTPRFKCNFSKAVRLVCAVCQCDLEKGGKMKSLQPPNITFKGMLKNR